MKNIICLLSIAILMFSCTDVVDLEVEQSDVRVTIDGVLTDIAGASYVKITQSANYATDVTFPIINNAEVAVLNVTSGEVQKFVFDEASSQYYPLDNQFIGEYGAEYRLDISIGNDRYSSSTQLMKKVPPFYEFAAYKEGEYPRYNDILEEGTYLFYSLIDNKVDGDYYRWQIWIDDVYFSTADDVLLNYDDFSGTGDTLISNRPYEVEEGEKIRMRQSRINKDVAEFWEQFSANGSTQGGPFSSPPAPLPSNVYNVNDEDDEVFGLFSVESFVDSTITVL